MQPKIFSRPRLHAPYTDKTLHMFTMRKPNSKHDLYNPPYQGMRRATRRTSGMTAKEERKKRVRAAQLRRETERMLGGTRL